MKDLCITTSLNQAYSRFIPIFVYFIHKTYPDYGIRIFLSNSINKNIRTCMDLIGAKDCILYENHFNDLPRTWIASKCYRWINYSKDFEEYKYIYIGDVDLLICEEESSLLDQHVEHCRTVDLCYSNCVRDMYPRRLTGLHFAQTKPWFDKMLPIMEKYRELIKINKIHWKSDEITFYKMVIESDLDILRPYNNITRPPSDFPSDYYFRPHHGIHIGAFRHGVSKTFFRREKSHVVYKKKEKYLSYFQHLINTDVCQEILKLCPLPEIGYIETTYKNFLNGISI